MGFRCVGRAVTCIKFIAQLHKINSICHKWVGNNFTMIKKLAFIIIFFSHKMIRHIHWIVLNEQWAQSCWNHINCMSCGQMQLSGSNEKESLNVKSKRRTIDTISLTDVEIKLWLIYSWIWHFEHVKLMNWLEWLEKI